MPVDGSLVSYTVTATNTSDTTKKTSLELDPGETEFEIRLIEGTYTLSVEGFLTEGESRKKILRGTYRNAASTPANTVTIDKEHPNPQVGKIYVNPFFDEGGTGTVSLKMNLSGCKIKSVKAVWKKQGADGTEKTATFDKGGSDLTTICFGGSESESEEPAFAFSESESTADIPVGFYTVDFYFYNDAAVQDGSTMVFSCFQSVNVWQHLTTDFWRNNGGSSYISDGKFTLTAEMLKSYARHLFYVHPEEKDTTLNEGTWYAPFDSVRTAVKKICAINDGEPYTVILLSDDTDESTTSYTSGNKAYIDIAPNTSHPLAVTILGKDDDDNDTLRTINAALTADRTGSVMYIGENAAVTLKNIHITGGYSSYNAGSGIINKGTLTMEDCTVSGCIATHCGGGGIGNFGTLSMNTCTVSGCTAEISGGAIFSNGTLTVKDCTISSCEADWGGGGISNGKTGTLTVIGGSISLCKGGSSSGGGGIYSQGTLTVTGCTISGNESYNGGGIRSDVSDASVTVSITDCEITCSMTGGKGGGISSKGPLTVTGCTIICDGTSGTSGLGIYNEGGTADIPVTVTDCTISGRKRVGYGGGIYNTGTLIVTGGTISSCEATKGGGIWNGGTLTVSGTSISSCKAAGYSDSCGGAIFSNGGETAAVLIVEGSTKISGCTAAKIGGGVYILNSTFTISGSASIPSATGAAKDNDVYLASGKTITVKGTLTAESPVATISLDDGEYTQDRQVLQAADGGAITADICEKFAVAQDPNGIEWSVTPDGTGTKGVLRNSTLYVRGAGAGWYTENPDYTASAGSDSNSGSKSAPFATIREALAEVNNMNDGASEYTIWVDGTITDSAAGANGMADISPASTLNLKIQSMSETTHATLDAQNNGRVMNISANAAVTLKNVNITNGNTADNGGGVYNSGTLTIDGGTITNCTAGVSGGGIYNIGTLTVIGCTISGCTADASGGGIYNEVTDASITCTLTECEITDCKASGTNTGNGGGGIYNASGTLELTDITITLESDATTRAAYRGGGVYNAGTLTITGGSITGGGRFSGNSIRNGGGIYNTGALAVDGVMISNFDTDHYGGGIYNDNGEAAADFVTIKNSTITNCGSSQCGSGICAYKGKLKLENVDIIGGTADTMGGIYCYSSELTIIGGKIEGFKGTSYGAIYNTSSKKFTMDGTTVSGNTVENSRGGGVFLICPFEIKNCTISGNTAGAYSDYNGGGLSIGNCTGTITNTTITGNTATGDGGGIYIFASVNTAVTDVTITDCTIKDNTARAGGGGVYISRSSYTAAVTITGGEISGNEAVCGGGIYNQGTLTVTGGTISNCTATQSGGGIYNDVSDASITCTLTDCEISGCKALGTESGQGGGGICNIAGTLELTGVNITGSGDETAQDARSGGGIYNKGTLTVTGGTIKNCTSLYAGGGVYNSTGTLKITDGTISTCITKEGRGGGICSSGAGASAEIKDCIIQSCEATTSSGGGVSNETGTLTMTGGTITGNTAAKSGGGVYNQEATLILDGGEISENHASASGVGVYCAGSSSAFTMKSGIISGNEGTVDTQGGGGVYVDSGTFAMENGTVSGNRVACGGGVFVGGTFTMSGGTISGNTATNSGDLFGGGGVAVKMSGTFTMTNGTITGNTATGNGGGVLVGGTFTMEGGSITSNTAASGGGVYKHSIGTFNANGGTVSGNTPDNVYNMP